MILSLCPNPSIDCIAELDTFRPGHVNRFNRLIEYPGGKAVHVALAIAQLKGNSNLMGIWAGSTGLWIRQECEKRNVKWYGLEIRGNNRKCYTLRSDTPGLNNSELIEPGPSLSSNDWQLFTNFFKAQLNDVRLVCMSGSWLLNAPCDAYSQLVIEAKENNIPTLLDCSGEQLDEALKVGFFGLHLNQFEAEKFCGSQDIHQLIKKIDGKVELLALTKGKEGLLLFYRGQLVSANVRIDPVYSSVGSGDCLTAGIAYAVSEGLPIEGIAAYGVTCGAANCLSDELGLLNKNHINELLPKVEVKIV